MPRIAAESIQRVIDSSDIVDVIGSYISLKRAGGDYKALCPFHKERTPSFTISPARQVYYCFGCQAGGSVIQFVQAYEHLGFADAVRKLAQRAGIHLVEEGGSGEDGPSDGERKRLLAIHREAAEWFHHLLLKEKKAKEARDYLRSRGIGGEIAGRWMLGYAPTGGAEFFQYASGKGFREKELVLSGLCGRRDSGGCYDRFRGRVMIPIYNDYGEVIAFSGRILDVEASPAKYVNSPETPIFTKGKVLFGLQKSKRALIERESAVVCEGQFDLISLYEAGVENVIASQGTAFTPQQARLLRRFVQTVVLCFDADSAGKKAVDRSLPHLLGQGLGVKVLALPAGQDPDSLVRSEGGERFAARVEGAREIIDYKLGQIDESGVLSRAAGVAMATKRMAEILKMIPDLVHREAAAGEVAVRLGVTPRNLLQSIDQAPEAREQEEEDENTVAPPVPLRLEESCVVLCRLSLWDAQVRAWLRERKNPSVCDLGRGWELLAKIVGSDFSIEDKASFATFLSELSPSEQSLVSAFEPRHLPKEEERLHSAQAFWKGLLRQQLLEEQEKIKIRSLQKNLKQEEMLEIQKQLLDIRRKLQEVASPV